MKTLLYISTFFLSFEVNAQNYLIGFSAKGVPVNTIKVENLATGESLTLNGSDVLNLKGSTVTTGISDNRLSSGIKIYPNPMVNSSTVEIYPPESGNTTISIFDMSGNQITQLQSYLDNSLQEFRLSGEGKGLYIINVRGDNYQLSGKLICNGTSKGRISIEKLSSNQVIDEKTSKSDTKGTQGIIDMLYLPGNRLKFTAISGEYRTILTDIPDQNKTITFDLMPALDAEKNNYHLVKIGNQTWLEENLKTTKYDNGSSIPLVTDSTIWSNLATPGYSWYKNNEVTYKDPHGALYNWYAVNSGNLCPSGWHVPTSAEWISMKDYLTINSHSYADGSIDVAKSIASKSKWYITQPFIDFRGHVYPVTNGSVGKNQETNNSTGFNAYASGSRHFNGSFTNAGTMAIWWSATGNDYASWDFSLYTGGYDEAGTINQASDYSRVGSSVRCIKD